MILKEADALTKWCPFARHYDVRNGEPVTVNRRDGKGDIDCRCIASDCMAWQWRDDTLRIGQCGLAS